MAPSQPNFIKETVISDGSSPLCIWTSLLERARTKRGVAGGSKAAGLVFGFQNVATRSATSQNAVSLLSASGSPPLMLVVARGKPNSLMVGISKSPREPANEFRLLGHEGVFGGVIGEGIIIP